MPQQDAEQIKERIVFFFVCMGVIAITYGVLFALDFLPEKPTTEPVKEVVENAKRRRSR